MTSEERKQTKKSAGELIKGELEKMTEEQKDMVLCMLIGANLFQAKTGMEASARALKCSHAASFR